MGLFSLFMGTKKEKRAFAFFCKTGWSPESINAGTFSALKNAGCKADDITLFQPSWNPTQYSCDHPQGAELQDLVIKMRKEIEKKGCQLTGKEKLRILPSKAWGTTAAFGLFLAWIETI
jgi:hypothetical protein